MISSSDAFLTFGTAWLAVVVLISVTRYIHILGSLFCIQKYDVYAPLRNSDVCLYDNQHEKRHSVHVDIQNGELGYGKRFSEKPQGDDCKLACSPVLTAIVTAFPQFGFRYYRLERLQQSDHCSWKESIIHVPFEIAL